MTAGARDRPDRARARAAARPARGEDGAAAVRARLQSYADRGVFRGFAEQPARGRKRRFTFRWLTPGPFTLTYDPTTGALAFPDLLPNVPARSELAGALRRFIRGRASPALPEHRRVDPARARVDCAVRKGALSVKLVARPGHHDYGTHRAVHLVQEVFVHLQSRFPEYMWENFDAPQE